MKVSFQFLFFILLILICTKLYSSEIIFTKPFEQNINLKLDYYLDNEADLKNISNIDFVQFSPVKSNNLVFQMKETSSWIKLQIKNPTNEIEKAYLSFSPSYMGTIEIYEAMSKQLISKTGSLTKENDECLYYEICSKINLIPGDNYFLVHTVSIAAGISVTLSDDQSFSNTKSKTENLFSLILGSLIILALYNIVIFLMTKNSTYLIFSFYVLALIGFQITITGFGKYFLPTEILGFKIHYLGSLLFANIVFIFLWLLTGFLLYSDRKIPKRIKIISFVLFSISGISILLLVTPSYYLSVSLTRVNGLLTLVALLYITIYLAIYEKSKIALLLLSSWLPFLVGVAVIIFSLNGIIPMTTYVAFYPAIASVFQSFILAMTVGAKILELFNTIILEQTEKLKAYNLLDENFKKLKDRDNIIRSYVNPTVLAEVSLNINPLEYKPTVVNKIILFSDLREYTTITESVSLEESYNILNQYFEAFNNAIVKHGGEVDKLIGDAIMATFSHADGCVNACIEFYKKLNDMNVERVNQQKKPLQVGVGISFGKILSANFGTSHKLDRTIVGDPVNIASRLETLTKQYKVKILSSIEFVNLLGQSYTTRYIDTILVKGKSSAVKVFEIQVDEEVAHYAEPE